MKWHSTSDKYLSVIEVNDRSPPLQQATATFSQTDFDNHSVATSIDEVFDNLGRAIYPEITDQIAVFETANDVGSAGGTLLEFNLFQQFGGVHTLGRFRLSATTDARDTFADGLPSGGDVTATWTVLDPNSRQSDSGITILTELPDHSILASGDTGGACCLQDIYTVSAHTTLTDITGIRFGSALTFVPGRLPHERGVVRNAARRSRSCFLAFNGEKRNADSSRNRYLRSTS
jgi:hypothetical protein